MAVIAKELLEKMKEKLQHYGLFEGESRMNIILGESDDPKMQIQNYEPNHDEQLERIQLTDNLSTDLSLIMQQAPQIALNINKMASYNYKLIFSPGVMDDLANGSLKLMESGPEGLRAIATNVKTGKITEIGKIKPVSGLTPTTLAVSFMQIATVLTNSLHLAEISKQLSQLNKGIDYIIEFMEAEQLGKLHANFNYLRETEDLLNHYLLREADILLRKHLLEDIELECRQIMDSLELTLKIPRENIERLNVAKSGANASNKIFSANILEFKKQTTTYLLAAYTRVYAARLSCLLSGNKHSALARTNDLMDKLSSLLNENEKFRILLVDKISKLNDCFFNSNKYQTPLIEAYAFNLVKFKKIYKQVELANSLNKSYIENSLTEPVALKIVLDETCKIVEVNRIINYTPEPC